LERWVGLQDTYNRLEPAIQQLALEGYGVHAATAKSYLRSLVGYRSDLSQRFDAEVARIPLLRNVVSSGALDRWAQVYKQAAVNLLIKYKPQFHALNATQILQTLAPVASVDEIVQGAKLFNTKAGKELLQHYGQAVAGKVGSGLGPIEDYNQGVAFLTMYNRGIKLGLEPGQAADYAFLRGNIYSQFTSLKTDQPILFHKLDPTGSITLFQRFAVKQLEQLVDLVKDRHASGAAKWLVTQGLLGGYKALTWGTGGYLGYELYSKLRKDYGDTVADLFYNGLPSLVGIDMSNSVMAYNPPFGSSFAEKLGNVVAGLPGQLVGSIYTAATNNKAVDPEVGRRVYRQVVQRLPLAAELDAVRRLMVDDYDMRDPLGRLKYKADVSDLLKLSLGFKPLGKPQTRTQAATFSKAEQLAEFITALKTKRDEVVDYAATHYGQAKLTGVKLPKELEDAVKKEVDSWNALWPEMSITGTDVMVRAKARARAGMQALAERHLKQAGKVGKFLKQEAAREEKPLEGPSY
jgi:hypothetical protein